ncbi:unnamed protein product [Cunninghamella echinulata]
MISTTSSSTSLSSSSFNDHYFHHHQINNNNNNNESYNQSSFDHLSSLSKDDEDEFNPSDLLLEQEDDTSSLLFFGSLDIDLDHEPFSSSPTTTSYDNNLKHKTSDLLHEKNKKRDQWLTVTPKSTPPMSPYEQTWDYFDASGEDSSSDDESNSSSLDYQTMNSNFQSISVQEKSYDNNNNKEEKKIQSLPSSSPSSSTEMNWENKKNNILMDTMNHLHHQKKLNKSTKGRINNKNNVHHRLTTSNTIKKPKLPKQTKKSKKSKTAINNNTNTSSSSSSSFIPPPPENNDHLEKVPPRSTCHPTLYQKLTDANMDWCRYCGTTEGVNWRPGPWGKRTLCNKHGCDYKGYGFACKLPRLDLTGYLNESIHDRDRPVLQFYCATCHQKESWQTNVLVRCEGCYKSYHQKCYHGKEQPLTDEFILGDQPWYCDTTCQDNVTRQRVVVEISRKRLPLMCAPTKNQNNNNNATTTTALCNNNNNNRTLSDRTTRGIRDISK